MKMNCWKFGLKAVFFVALMVALSGSVVMILWNNLVPALFAGPVINFGQALGLLVLARLLTGGFGGWMRGRGMCGHRWKHRWHNMSPEEREKMKERFMGYCNRHHKTAAENES